MDPCFVETNEETNFTFVLIHHIQVKLNLDYLGIVRYILFQNILYIHKSSYLQSCINEKQYPVVNIAGKSVF